MAEAKCPYRPTCDIPAEQPTEAKFFAGGITCKRRANIVSDSCCSRVVQIRGHNKHCEDGSHVIYTLERNYYVIEFAFQAEYEDSCCDPYIVKLKDVTDDKVLAITKAWPCNKTTIRWEGVLEKCSVLAIKICSKKSSIYKFKLCGGVDINQKEYDRRLELDKTTAFDIDLNIQYIPSFPPQPPFPAPTLKEQWPDKDDVFPWESINIPWRSEQESIPNGTSFPNGNWYDKFQSIQYSVFFYLGVDMFTVEPNSPTITIFIKNFLDRGYQNYLKKVYMFALRCENMPYYAEKIDTMLNEAYSAFVVERQPVISSFKDILVRFFLAMHVGYDNYPPEIIEYFKGFIDVVGFGDPLREGRYEIMLRGNELAPCVQKYFAERNIAVIQDEDKTSFMYWWHLAGLPEESLLIESIHNIVAFSQYVNVLYKVIADKLWAKRVEDGLVAPGPIAPLDWWFPPSPIPLYIPVFPVPPNVVGPIDFFEKMRLATTEEEQLRVAFEVFRLMNTNTNAFSKLMPVSETSTKVQARHIWQLIMINNQPLGATFEQKASFFFKYTPDQYPGTAADLNFNCPPQPPNPPLVNLDVANENPLLGNVYFEQSTVDGTIQGDGTVLDVHKPKLIPVLSTPLYAPKGFGYRRCAGEILNYFLTIKMLVRFKDVEWEVRQPKCKDPCKPHKPPKPCTKEQYFKNGGYQTIAPFLAVPDDIYAVPPAVVVPPPIPPPVNTPQPCDGKEE